ncbi:acyl carrier protein [Roseovarius sp.]|uniref:acyl carrier protein n=1 Tax=Roseovarius sp. TaxID=1486281 RepID=UPI003A973CB0
MTVEAPLKKPADAGAIRDWMVAYITSVIEVQQDPFPVNDRFDLYGLDSIEITIMCGMMEEQFKIEVNPNEVFDHPSVSELSVYLAHRVGESSAAT